MFQGIAHEHELWDPWILWFHDFTWLSISTTVSSTYSCASSQTWSSMKLKCSTKIEIFCQRFGVFWLCSMPIRVDQCHSLFHFGFFFSGVPCNIAFIKFLIFLFHGVFWPPRIPFWGTIKLAVTAWLVLPQFRGGEFVYEQFVRPYIINNKVVRTVDDDEYFSDNQRKLLFSLSPETQSLVAQFIYENGEDAFHSFLAVVNPQMYFLAHIPLWCILLVCKLCKQQLAKRKTLVFYKFSPLAFKWEVCYLSPTSCSYGD